MFKNFIVIVFLTFGILRPCQAENILLLTDIHFNPYSDCLKKDHTIPCNTLQKLIENPIEKWSAFLDEESINSYKE